MRIESRTIPVAGISDVPAAIYDIEQAQSRRQRHELLMLTIAASLSVLLVCAAWVALALD